MNPQDYVTLREYIERLFHDYAEAHQREHALTERAMERAREVVDARLEGMNELRNQLLSERGTYVRRELFDGQMEAQSRRIEQLERGESNLQGRLTMIGAALGVGLVILQLLFYYVLR